ncbi:MAG: biotin/lipoyl-binding protein [Ruminococcaceae bacterium]|nr:biotin/lipoyl-binding protein [Oscillospiraceae bacterium]
MKYVVTLNGKNYEVDVTETDAIVTGVTEVPVMVAAAPAAAPVAAPVEAPKAEEEPAAPAAPAAPTASGTQVKAPMPGTILAVKASAGQAVKAGDVIVVLEAMKMENDIVAPCDGTIKEIVVTKGTTVNTDDVLAII